MSEWIDIDDCTDGYYLFKLKSTYSSGEFLLGEVVDGVVWFNNGRPCDYLYDLCGEALSLTDINNNGEVLVEAKSG